MQITIAKNFRKIIGLIGKKKLTSDEALLLPHCRQVHTWFMRFPIDVVFIDKFGFVVAVEEGLPPWRLSQKVHDAEGCIEFRFGEIKKQNICIGDNLHKKLSFIH